VSVWPERQTLWLNIQGVYCNVDMSVVGLDLDFLASVSASTVCSRLISLLISDQECVEVLREPSRILRNSSYLKYSYDQSCFYAYY